MSSLSSNNNNKPSSIISTNAPNTKNPTYQILELHYNNIRKLNIEKYALELDTYGYCIVPPEVHGVSMETINKLKDLVLQKASEVTGCKWTEEDGPLKAMQWPSGTDFLIQTSNTNKTRPKPASTPIPYNNNKKKNSNDHNEPFQMLMQQMGRYHREFRDLALNPVCLALIEHMIGPRASRFSSNNAVIKWKGAPSNYATERNLAMHADQGGVPLPWGTNALNANSNWCLTDYTLDNGALAIVPGSHRRHQNPGANAASEAIPVECPAGSVILFHGATWHGAYPRKKNGCRIMLANYFRNRSIQSQEDFQNSFPRSLAEDCSNPKLYKILCGYLDGMPYQTVRTAPSAL